MGKIKYFVGIDIASEDFTSTVITAPDNPIVTEDKISNSSEGFQNFIDWLETQGANKTNCIICIENTGVYSEHLCYSLHTKGYNVAVEAPHKVKRAFHELLKNDRVDSKQIAEYAYRFQDQLPFWKPNDKILEQIKVLFSVRENFTKQIIANTNALKALKRKVVQTPMANDQYEQMIKKLKKGKDEIDKEIEKLINSNPTFKHLADIADSVPGVGKNLAGTLMVITDAFSCNLDHRKLASHIGIGPLEHSSGKSVYRKARSRRHGHQRVRKLLHLAARSVATHVEEFRKYYLRKIAEGKPPKLVYNNIANKILKIVCAVEKSQTAYIKNYKSVNPLYLKNT